MGGGLLLCKAVPFFEKRRSNCSAAKEFSAPALLHNLQEIKRLIPATTKVMVAVVKADAYGCDAKTVASTLERAGVDFFAVATLEEALNYGELASKSRLLILAHFCPTCQRAETLFLDSNHR